MLTRLRLERFKSFLDAELSLGPLTLLVGTNASGKSNIRDALRFLHGVSQGYSLADILGEKYTEGGQLQWAGIRGGTREVAYQGARTFALEVSFTYEGENEDESAVEPHPVPMNGFEREASYRIEVDAGQTGRSPRVVKERLVSEGRYLFDSHPDADTPTQPDPRLLYVRQRRTGTAGRLPTSSFSSHQPVLSQIVSHAKAPSVVKSSARQAMAALGSMRFLDLTLDAMRRPSLPGQTVLGDRGENLSSVLQQICEEPHRKQALLQWIQELTPMDAKDFEFPVDLTGRILVRLIEEGEQTISANSASDGTLRFLAMTAAMLGPEVGRFYFFEELENGIHPARLYLLLQLIEQQVRKGQTQVVATTHSPQLLSLLSKGSLEFASLTYRLEGEHDTQIRRILDIPEARRVIQSQDIARLHESGWLEDAVAFLADQDSELRADTEATL